MQKSSTADTNSLTLPPFPLSPPITMAVDLKEVVPKKLSEEDEFNNTTSSYQTPFDTIDSMDTFSVFGVNDKSEQETYARPLRGPLVAPKSGSRMHGPGGTQRNTLMKGPTFGSV